MRIAILVALILITATTATAAVRTATSPGRLCFSAATWDARDGDRPCVHVRIFEDGTYSIRTAQADGDPVPTD